MKLKKFLSLTILLLTATFNSQAATITDSQRVVYEILSEPSGTDPGTCRVDSRQPVMFTSVNIPTYVKSNNKTYEVVEIGSYAFYENTSLRSVVIPESVIKIGIYAFSGCSALQTMEIPKTVTTIGNSAFLGCSGLTQVAIPSTVTSMGQRAFAMCYSLRKLTYNAVDCPADDGFTNRSNYHWLYYCYNLTEVVIGNNVKTIPASVFYGVGALTSIEIPSSVTSIGSQAFYGCTSLRRLVYNAGCPVNEFIFSMTTDHWLNGCSNLEEIVIGDNVNYIPDYAFYNLTSLSSVELPNTVKTIGHAAFMSCTSLTEITIPSSVTEIGESAFFKCSALETVTVPSTLSRIGMQAFYDCESLTGFEIPASLTEIEESTFFSCVALSDIKIPESITSIGEDAFTNCFQIRSIEIPSKVKYIGKNAFDNCTGLSRLIYNAENCTNYMSINRNHWLYDCSNLTEVIVGNNVKTVPANAFYNLSSLTSLEISSSVTEIGDDAFYNCDNLEDLIIDDLRSWCLIKFNNQYSNPIYYSKSFRIPGNENPVGHMVISLPGQTVSSYAFYNAQNLTTIRIEAKGVGVKTFAGCNCVTDLCLEVDEIGNYGFSDMTGLNTIYSLTGTPPAAADNVFSEYEGITLNVPSGAVSDYAGAATCWWRFINTVPHDFNGIENVFTADHELFSGIDKIVENRPATAANNDIYTLGGVLVKRNATAADIKLLSPGIYIFNGRKVMVR